MTRGWHNASREQLYLRMCALEAELSAAARLLELREEWNEKDGIGRSPVITDLQVTWKALLEAKPEPKAEKDAA